MILREELSSTQLYESGIIALSSPVYAIRVEALCMDENDAPVSSGMYAYSTDGVAWRDLPLEAYTFLPQAAQTLYFRAILPVGVTLRGIHAEGVTLKASTFVPNLVTEPYAVRADDYGAFDADEQRYELQWNDDNKLDATFSSTVLYDVYRNGELIATVTEKKYTDTDYRSSATYQVAARRVYSDPKDGRANILDRSSNQVKATVRVMDRPVPPVVVTPTPAVTLAPVTLTPAPQPQVTAIPTTLKPVIVTPTPQILPTRSPSANTATPKPTEASLLDFTTENPYDGGSYGTEAATHEASLDLDQSLLGPHRFCSLGFEPVNFNTGNFFLQARDFAVSDVGDVALDLIRTYNSQSAEMDTPFGAKWGSEITQSLKVGPDGTVAWRRADGSEIKFVPTQEGGYASNSAEYEDLFVQENGYRILCTDGTAYVFDASGFLTQIEKNNGQQIIHLTRGEKGHLRTISMPSDREIDVQTDADGHITKITLPGDMTVTYKYKDNNLVSVTDSQGQTIRYTYNKDALMTAWYDGNGTRQVLNTYDDQLRVVAQTDGNGGKYRLEYEDNRTITTDAEGNSVIYERDAMQRTTRIVDAMGGVTEFTYGEQGEIISRADPLGQITVYEYNKNGDKITETDPRGASVRMTWDDEHHLLSLTDQNGNTTTYTYDEAGNLLTETAANGGVTVYSYDAQGKLIAKTDALGYVTRYEYTDGLLTRVTDPLDYTTVYTYDDHGNLSSMTDALGQVTQYEYDVKGNLLRLTFADGTCVCYTYDALGNQTSMTNPEGNVTKYVYDGLGNLIETILPDKTTQRAAYNKNNQLISATDALGGKTTYTYDANGNRLSVTDPAGNQTTSEYDAAGRQVRETNALGGVTEYTYDEVGLPLSVTDPTGATQTMAYDLMGNLLTRTLASGAVISAEYDSMGHVIRQVNALGGVTETTYDLLGRVTSVTDPLGAITTYTYNANGNLLTATDALGNVTSYVYDALNRVISETAPNGGVTAYAYDSVGNLVSVTDALGCITRYDYDANGNLVSMTDAIGQTITLSYDKNGNTTAATQKNGGVLATTYDKTGRILTETDANGHTSRYNYNKAGQVASVTDAQGQKATFAYDALGNITKITAPGKSITSYAYDTAGRTVSMTDPEGCVTLYSYNADSQIASVMVNGNETAYEYDAAGNVSAVTDAEGRRVTFAYDLNSNLTEILYPDGSKETTEYDALGRVVKSTPRTGLATAYLYDAMGNVVSIAQGEQITTYKYDLLGHPVAMTTPDGSVTAYAYDALGNLISETDPLGSTTTFAYNAESLLELVTYANGATQRLTYDLAGNITGETDAEGNTKQYRYDRVNRLTAVIDEAGRKTSYAYDAQDNITRVTDALGHITRYTYDKNSNLLSETDALGNRVQYAYTPEGWLASTTKADGTALTFDYDKTGSLLTQNVGDGQSIRSSYNAIGMVTEVSSAEGSIVYQYDVQGNLVSVTNTNGDVVSYTYDAYGNKTTMTYPDGRVVSYTYDAAGHRVETTNSSLTTEYTYDNVGNLLTQVTTGETEIAYAYSYNRNGYITGEERTADGQTITSAYAYDVLGQLTSFLQSTGYGEQYAYDKAGNMTKKVITPMHGADAEAQTVTLKMSYNEVNQLTTMASGKDKITYKYDKNGSMIEKVLSSRTFGKLTDTYAYNALDQLTSYTGYDGYQQVLTYDANGMRLSKSEYGNSNRSTLEELLRGNVAGLPEAVEPSETTEDYNWATTEYLYDITAEYYQVIEANTDSETTTYEYGLERIAAYGSDAKTSYAYDGRGSVASVNGYTPFGEQMGNQKASGYGYNGEDYDAATGMLNLRARQYEPAMNRFSQKDIVRGQATSPLTLNRYGFCVNSPVMHTDPSGESVIASIGNWWNNAKQTTIGKVVDTLIVKPVTSVAKTIAKVVKPVVNAVSGAAKKANQVYQAAKQDIAAVDTSRPTCEIEKTLIWKRACSKFVGDEAAANEITRQLEKIQSFDKYDWLFLTGDSLMDDSISLEDRFAILDVLNEKHNITAEDLVNLGFYTEETRYQPYLFGLLNEDVAGNYAALLELSYRVTREGTTVWELSLEEQQMRSQQQFAMLYYLGVQAGLSRVQAYNAAGSAIRMDGATVAAPGYESVPSDYFGFNFTEYDIQHGLGKFGVNNFGYYGVPGTSSRIRIIKGTVNEASMLFDHLSRGYTSQSSAGYGGITRHLPNGGFITFRPNSKSGSPAIDIHSIPGINNQRIHFEGR